MDFLVLQHDTLKSEPRSDHLISHNVHVYACQAFSGRVDRNSNVNMIWFLDSPIDYWQKVP